MRKADVRKKQQQQSKVQKDRSSLNKQENKLSFFFSLLNVKDDKKDKLEYRKKKEACKTVNGNRSCVLKKTATS